MTTTHIFADEQDRRRHIDANDGKPEHRFVDGGICEVCGTGMQLADAYAWAEQLIEEAMETLTSAVIPDAPGADPYSNSHEHVQATNIAIGAALEQLREDRP